MGWILKDGALRIWSTVDWSPFPLCRDNPGHSRAYHVKVAHPHNKICIGGIGSKKLIESRVPQNTSFFHLQPVYDWTDKQYQTGVDAPSLYQSER